MNIAARYQELLGPEAVATDADTLRAFAVDGRTPQCVLFPQNVDEVSRCVVAAGETDLVLMPVGAGTQLGFGNPPQRYDVALSTRRLRRILAHEAADMTVTVEAGATLAEVNATLRAANQHLPLDPPHPERITIGALIATDASGPLRFSQGKVRDLLIGIKVVLADGTLVKGGGRVVKNVAGYDLMKLFTGSFGTLATVVEATFKVRPRPEHEALFIVATGDLGSAVDFGLECLGATMAPLYLEVLNQAAAAALELGSEPLLVVGCGGGADEIDAQRECFQRIVHDRLVRTFTAADGAAIYGRLRDFAAMQRDEGTWGCKLSVLPTALKPMLSRIEAEAGARKLESAILSHVGNGIAYLRGNDTDADHVSQFAQWLRAAARQADGWVVFDLLPTPLKAGIDTWGTEVPALSLMRGIKGALDPRNRLSPGRFLGGI